MSKWVAPSRYYVAFPYGIYNPSIVREHRISISSNKDFYLSHSGSTVKDGEYLGFTFGEEQYKSYRDHLRETSTGAYKPADSGEFPSEKLPLEERYSARFFSLDKVFGIGDTSGANVVETPHYFNIDSWEGLRTYLGSDHRIYRHNTLLTGKKFNRIGEDIEEE